MLLRIWRFAAITLTALSMGPALSHALELRPKMQYDGSLYLTLFKSLYEFYGKVGGYFEIGAVLAAVVLAFLVRNRRPAFLPTLIGAACLVLAHAAFWIWVFPANNLMASWSGETLPADWTRIRNQWEYTHLARFFLQLIALASLEVSVLRETPLAVEKTDTAGEPLRVGGARRRAAS